jgi:hypothetical protein
MARSRNELQSNVNIGDLVEYLAPCAPWFKQATGIVLCVGRIESNVYEKGYWEVDVYWHGVVGDKTSYETREDASHLKKLS